MRVKCSWKHAVLLGVAGTLLLGASGAWARIDTPFGGLPATVPVATEDPSILGNTIPSMLEVTVSTSAPNDLEVTVNLSTANLAYLEMWLCHADNSHGVQLVQQGTLSGTALAGTVFDDKAAVGITSGTAPYTGHFRPAEPLNMVANSTSTFKLMIKNYDRNNEVSVASAVAGYLYWPDDLPQRGASVFSATDLPDNYQHASANLWPICDQLINKAEANMQIPAFIVENVAVRVSQAGRCDRMEIFVQHVPSGTTRKLKAMNLGGAATVMTDTVFTDYADENMTTGTEPFTGKFLPSESISVFNGLNAQGEWRVSVVPQSVENPSNSTCTGGSGNLLAVDLIFNDPTLQYNCSLAVPWFVDNSGVAQGVPPKAQGTTSIITLHNNRADALPCIIEYYTQAGTFIGPFENNTFSISPNASVGFRPSYDDPDAASGGIAGGQEDNAARLIPNRPLGTENGNDNKKNGSIVIRWAGEPTDLQGAIKQVANTPLGVMSDSYSLPPGAVKD